MWEILDRKSYLINCIPLEKAAWGTLHQAAYLGNAEAVRKLLSYPACDPNIRTTQDLRKEHGLGKKPIELTKDPNIIKMFEEDARKTNEATIYSSHTFVAVENIREPIGGCIQLALCGCKGALIPQDMKLDEMERASIFKLMAFIFKYVDQKDNCRNVKKNVALRLQQYSITLGQTGEIGSETLFDSKQHFYERAIKLYAASRKQLF